MAEQLTAENLLGALVHCPHCDQLLRCTQVIGTRMGMNPFTHRRGKFFLLRLSDGARTRMWAEGPDDA